MVIHVPDTFVVCVCVRVDVAVEKQLPDEDGFYLACKITDVPTNQGLKVTINSSTLAIFKVKTDKTHIYAIDNSCSHQGTSLFGTYGSLPSIELLAFL